MASAINFAKAKDYRIAIIHIKPGFYINTIATNGET
jgi:hypothetical protein